MKINLSIPLIRQYVIVTIVNLGGLTTGISLGWSSPVIVKLRNGTDTPFTRPITEEEGSWIVSGGYLVVGLTNLFGGMLLFGLGRKFCIILTSLPKLLAAIWTIFVTEVWMLILCRVIMTVCDCFIFIVVPVYSSEIACKEHRGSLCTFLHLITCLGIVISLSVGPFLSYTVFNSFIAITFAVTTLPVLFLPDSPFYLYSKGRQEEALKVLLLIRDSDAVTKKELEDYELSINKHNFDFITLLTNKLFIKSLMLALLLFLGSNMIGYNAISFYLQTIFQSTNTSLRPEISSVIIGCIQLFAALCSSFIANICGRRTILIYSLFVLLLGMMCLGIFFIVSGIDGYTITGFMNYLPLISLILVIYSYGIGIGNLMFVVTTELFVSQYRAVGLSICTTGSSLLTFVTSKYFAQVRSALGPALTFFLFCIICLFVIVLIVLFLPETKGKTFNEIQGALSERLFQIRC